MKIQLLRLVALSAGATVCALANAGNLLYNGDFSIVGPNGSPVTATNLYPGVCAADGWETFQNQPNTATITALVSPPPAGLPTGTPTAIYFGTPEAHTNWGSEIDQVFKPYGTGPKDVSIGVWVYLLEGTVGVGVGNGGSTGYLTATSTKRQWIYLSADHYAAGGNDNFIIGNADYGSDHTPAKFYATDATVMATPEPGTYAVLGLGALGLFVKRRRK